MRMELLEYVVFFVLYVGFIVWIVSLHHRVAIASGGAVSSRLWIMIFFHALSIVVLFALSDSMWLFMGDAIFGFFIGIALVAKTANTVSQHMRGGESDAVYATAIFLLIVMFPVGALIVERMMKKSLS